MSEERACTADIKSEGILHEVPNIDVNTSMNAAADVHFQSLKSTPTPIKKKKVHATPPPFGPIGQNENASPKEVKSEPKDASAKG